MAAFFSHMIPREIRRQTDVWVVAVNKSLILLGDQVIGAEREGGGKALVRVARQGDVSSSQPSSVQPLLYQPFRRSLAEVQELDNLKIIQGKNINSI